MPRFRSLLDYYRYQKAHHRVTQEKLRKRWGLKCQSHVHALIYGKCRPRPRLARVIAEDTGIDILVLLGVKQKGQEADNPKQEETKTGPRNSLDASDADNNVQGRFS